jgi:two-component system, NarL family, response regulator NreC
MGVLMITVLLVDDNGPIRKNLRSLLEAAEDIQIVATATNGVDAIAMARSHRPDVAVMDISMPMMDGIEATEQIRECCRLTRVILLTGFDDPEHVQRALQVGGKGYVLKDSVGEDLLNAIHAVQQGSHYFSEKIAGFARDFMTGQE